MVLPHHVAMIHVIKPLRLLAPLHVSSCDSLSSQLIGLYVPHTMLPRVSE